MMVRRGASGTAAGTDALALQRALMMKDQDRYQAEAEERNAKERNTKQAMANEAEERNAKERNFKSPPCVAGTHSSSGYSPCTGTSCAAGHHGPVAQMSAASATCADCAAGRFNADPGAGACAACPAGKWQGAMAASSCTSCAAGRGSASTAGYATRVSNENLFTCDKANSIGIPTTTHGGMHGYGPPLTHGHDPPLAHGHDPDGPKVHVARHTVATDGATFASATTPVRSSKATGINEVNENTFVGDTANSIGITKIRPNNLPSPKPVCEQPENLGEYHVPVLKDEHCKFLTYQAVALEALARLQEEG